MIWWMPRQKYSWDDSERKIIWILMSIATKATSEFGMKAFCLPRNILVFGHCYNVQSIFVIETDQTFCPICFPASFVHSEPRDQPRRGGEPTSNHGWKSVNTEVIEARQDGAIICIPGRTSTVQVKKTWFYPRENNYLNNVPASRW